MNVSELLDVVAEGGVLVLGEELEITDLLMSYIDEFTEDGYKYEIINGMVKFTG